MHKRASLALILAGSFLLAACSSGSDSAVKKSSTNIQQPSSRTHTTQANVSARVRFANTLASHNAVRAQHNLARLSWSNNLAAYAQQWANHLASTNNCKMRHRPSSNPYGENLWWGSARSWSDGLKEVQNISINRVVEDWASEIKYYNYNTNRCQFGQQCGHYTQIVWKETTEVGCAYAQCRDKSQLWVCNYNPPGNYIGERPF